MYLKAEATELAQRLGMKYEKKRGVKDNSVFVLSNWKDVNAIDWSGEVQEKRKVESGGGGGEDHKFVLDMLSLWCLLNI